MGEDIGLCQGAGTKSRLRIASVSLALFGALAPAQIHPIQAQVVEPYVAVEETDVAFVERLLGSLSMPNNVELRKSDAPKLSARAFIDQGIRVIEYSPTFMARVRNPINDWAALGLFAHELGHHIAGHTLSNTTTPAVELAADEWAGFVLGFIGANQLEAENAVENYAPILPTLTHPGRERRRTAVIQGWQNANRQIPVTASAIKCRELLDVMGIHWSWFSEVGSKCYDSKTFLGWANIPNPQVIDYFLELGMDPNVRGEDGRTALHQVVSAWKCEGIEEAVHSLLGASPKADPTLLDDSGMSAIGLAAIGSISAPSPRPTCDAGGWQDPSLRYRLARIMLETAKIRGLDLGYYRYFEVAKSGTPLEFYYFILNGSDGGRVDDEGNTALHHAVIGCNLGVMRLLFDASAQLGETYMYPGAQNLRNKRGERALELAAERRATCPDVHDFLEQLIWD